MVVNASSGTITRPYALLVVGTKRWRAVFDLTPKTTTPVDGRLFLRHKGEALSETWL